MIKVVITKKSERNFVFPSQSQNILKIKCQVIDTKEQNIYTKQGEKCLYLFDLFGSYFIIIFTTYVCKVVCECTHSVSDWLISKMQTDIKHVKCNKNSSLSISVS